MSEVRGELLVAISLGDAWGISISDCQGSLCCLLILSLRTVPNVSAYRPDYLFQTVMAFWEVSPVDRFYLKTCRTDY